jgi:ComF family protein
VLDLLFPRRCLVCASTGSLLCRLCRERLPRLPEPLCARCGAPAAWPVERCLECSGRRLAFASARAALAYDPAVRAFVRGWKEGGLRRLDRLAAELVAEHVPQPEAPLVAFVPADRERTLKRGHHPAERLALALAELWQLPAAPLLRRTRPVADQRGLSVAERRRNVAGAFEASGRIRGKVVLVDDVYTTGATAAAAASALRRAGAKRVEVVTLARALRTR